MCLIKPPDLPDPPPPAPDPVEDAAEGPVSGIKIREKSRGGQKSGNASLTIPRSTLNIP